MALRYSASIAFAFSCTTASITNILNAELSLYAAMYAEFRKLVEKYNNGLQVKAEELSSKIADLKIEKRMLQADIKELETKKKILVNA